MAKWGTINCLRKLTLNFFKAGSILTSRKFLYFFIRGLVMKRYLKKRHKIKQRNLQMMHFSLLRKPFIIFKMKILNIIKSVPSFFICELRRL